MQTQSKNIREDLVFKDECFKIVGVAMAVQNTIGCGFEEKVYQRAMAIALTKSGFKITEQLYAPIYFEDKVVGKNYFDFLINDSIVVELKRGDHFSLAHIEQLNKYIKIKKLKLGILIYFAPHGIHYKRIVNLY